MGNKRIKFNRSTEPDVYDAEFYEKSAGYYKKALPYIGEFLMSLNPTSVVDVGCGNGDMLATIQGKVPVLGIDFSTGAVQTQVLQAQNFLCADLTLPLNVPHGYLQKGDVVISLEVFEHLPAEFEDVYLQNVLSLSPRILVLSCATPRQWGRHHYNPHEPEYVIEKMKTLNYVVNQQLSDQFKHIKYLAKFYRANTFVYEKVV